jgi:hypothetical protein
MINFSFSRTEFVKVLEAAKPRAEPKFWSFPYPFIKAKPNIRDE